MGSFATRQVILRPFPFSDLSASKLRPALLLASAGRGDWLLCQITSNPYADPHAVVLQNENFVEGSLQRVSYVRAGKLFTAHESLFQRAVGSLKPEQHGLVVDLIVSMVRVGAYS
ncbi:MazF family transcriptional regulator [Azohydromonas australica]|uniref:MazF family transcriptional regulator n=1 Tax=Azohydromonas australica TaxID=364039 RepID=UPI0003F86869|nr:MazF family transcriptional regulator [Azohydromonas australica]